MKDLAGFQHELKEALPTEGISHVLKALKEALPDNSPKYNAVLQLDSEYRDLKLQLIEGTLSDDDLRISKNLIRKRLLELVDSLEEDDFDAEAEYSVLEPDEDIRQGHVLYHIPQKMELEKETRCRVRIAFEKAMLIEDIDIDEDTAFKENIRLSDFMRVEIQDPSADGVFEIRSTTEPIQFIDADDYTEWKFYVKPLKPGQHILELKVCIMLVIDGKEVVREKTLEENVVIIAEPVEAEEETFNRLPESYAVASTATQKASTGVVKKTAAAAAAAAPKPKAKATKAVKRSKAMGMSTKAMAASAGLVLSLGIVLTLAFTPEDRRDWWKAHYLEGDAAAYDKFLAEHEQSEYADDAIYYRAKAEESPEALDNYILEYPDGKHTEEAARSIDKLAGDTLEPSSESMPDASTGLKDTNENTEEDQQNPLTDQQQEQPPSSPELVATGDNPSDENNPPSSTPSKNPPVRPVIEQPKEEPAPNRPPTNNETPVDPKPNPSSADKEPTAEEPGPQIVELEIANNIVFKGHNGPINSVAFSADGKRLLTGSNDKTAKLWNLEGKEIQSFIGHTSKVRSVAFSPDGKSILTGGDDNTARLWNLQGEELKTFQGHDGKVLAVAFSPDGKKILTGSVDKTAILWDLDGKELQRFSGHTYWVRDVHFSPDGQHILTASYDKTAKIWNLQGKTLRTFRGHTNYVTSAVFSPDQKHILTGSYDKTARLWNWQGKEIRLFKGHNDWVMSVAFAPDNRSILTGSYDHAVKIWDLKARQLPSPKNHTNKVISVAFSPSGRYLLASQVDGVAKLWKVIRN